MSTPHNLPWEDTPVPEDMQKFRDMDEIESDLFYV
jgi:hypothetical protein